MIFPKLILVFHCCFISLQWRWPAFVFLVYRLALAIYSISIVIYSIFKSLDGEYPWPTQVTHWSYSILTLHLVYSAIIALIHACRRSKRGKISTDTHPYGTLPDENPLGQKTTPEAELPLYLKFDWFLFAIASGSAPVVTVVYWVYLAPDKGVPFLQNDSINEHLVNSVIVVLELAISAIPVRLLHFVYLTTFAFTYAIFTVIYWAFDHKNIIYKSFTNWNQPTDSIIRLAILMFVVAPVIQFMLFCVYQIRLIVYERLYHESYTRPAPMQ